MAKIDPAQARALPARLPDWRPRLGQYMARVAGLPFRPGSHDCALFVAGAVEAMTGFDPAAEYRGRYRDLAAGGDLLRAAGFADHLEMTAAWCPPVAPALARVGDLAILPADGDAGALGVFQGGAVYVLTLGGLSLVNRLNVERAFSV